MRGNHGNLTRVNPIPSPSQAHGFLSREQKGKDLPVQKQADYEPRGGRVLGATSEAKYLPRKIKQTTRAKPRANLLGNNSRCACASTDHPLVNVRYIAILRT